MNLPRAGRAPGLGAVLFPAFGLLLAIPLAGAFAPILDGGAARNLARAFSDPRFARSFGYGVSQAAASAVLAALVGIPGAFLLAKRRFPGKRFLSALSAVPFCVPPLIIAIGFVLYYGQEGALNRALVSAFGLSEPPLRFLYSFWGVVAAHGFYNFPVVMRFVADAWAGSPKRHEDAARLLGASEPRVFLTVTLPSILPSLGAAMSLVFLMCFYSFVIVLLFGGPGVGTPEVELYRAARFEFDRPLASSFALVETIVAMSALAAYGAFERRAAGDRRDSERGPSTGFRTVRGALAAALYGAILLVCFVGPLAAIVAESLTIRTASRGAWGFGLGNYASLLSRRGFGVAVVNTAALGLASATLASATGFALSIGLKRTRSPILSKVLPLLPLGVSSVVLAYGWSAALGRPSVFALAAVQAVSAYPFALRAIQSSVGLSDERYADAARSLGSSPLGATLRVRLPIAAPSIASGFALAFAMSAGDANAMIAAPVGGFETLALLLYRLAGAYRLNEACAAAVLLAMATGFIFFLKDARDGLS
ncbi:MAG: iron ABC transporter permease [Spirochaetes bacterium]|nr:iron ABC transporter permease [Spirochaetota bacterium]MBU1080756.1 iron ABC transporter permease [Spirochaetota bacterium]